jgi:1,4-dihydroxy-2-naphthoate octaprenyltransferase
MVNSQGNMSAIGGSAWPPMGSIAWPAFVASLPIAALTTNILVIDNIRDRE